MLKIINLVLLIGFLISGIILIHKRYQTRLDSTQLSILNDENDMLDKEYTKLELEEGTFSSNLLIHDYAIYKLGLIQPNKNNILSLK